MRLNIVAIATNNIAHKTPEEEKTGNEKQEQRRYEN